MLVWIFYSLQSAFIPIILFGHTKGKPEDGSSVLDSTWICYVTRASHLTLVIDHLRNGDSNTYSVPNSMDELNEYAWDRLPNIWRTGWRHYRNSNLKTHAHTHFPPKVFLNSFEQYASTLDGGQKMKVWFFLLLLFLKDWQNSHDDLSGEVI